MSERIKFITYKNKKMMLVDLIGCAADEISPVLMEAIKVMTTVPLKSVFGITDVTGVKFNRTSAKMMKEYAEKTIPHLKAGASVGITGIEKVGYDAIMMLIGAHIPVFKTREEAFEWLSQQA